MEDPDHPGKIAATCVGKASGVLTADNFNPERLDFFSAVVSFREGSGYYAFDAWQDCYEKSYLSATGTRTWAWSTACRGSCSRQENPMWWRQFFLWPAIPRNRVE